MTTKTTAPERELRADAVRNRARILEAARLVFAERGLGASLDEVAKRAGVGVGTLYRRFADRDDLIEALFVERTLEQVARLTAALDVADAWTGLIEVLELTCGELAHDRGLRELFLSTEHGRERVSSAREKLHPLTEKLVTRARTQGRLRDGFSATDVPVILAMVSSIGDFAGEAAPELWRRSFYLIVDGMRTRPKSADLGSPLTVEQLEAIMAGR